jgi:hypothetical protein
MRIFIAPEIWPASLMISIILRWKRAPQPQTLPHNTLYSRSHCPYIILIHISWRAAQLGFAAMGRVRLEKWSGVVLHSGVRVLNLWKVTLQQHQVKRSCMHAADRRVVSKKCPVVFSLSHSSSRERSVNS